MVSSVTAAWIGPLLTPMDPLLGAVVGGRWCAGFGGDMAVSAISAIPGQGHRQLPARSRRDPRPRRQPDRRGAALLLFLYFLLRGPATRGTVAVQQSCGTRGGQWIRCVAIVGIVVAMSLIAGVSVAQDADPRADDRKQLRPPRRVVGHQRSEHRPTARADGRQRDGDMAERRLARQGRGQRLPSNGRRRQGDPQQIPDQGNARRPASSTATLRSPTATADEFYRSRAALQARLALVVHDSQERRRVEDRLVHLSSNVFNNADGELKTDMLMPARADCGGPCRDVPDHAAAHRRAWASFFFAKSRRTTTQSRRRSDICAARRSPGRRYRFDAGVDLPA